MNKEQIEYLDPAEEYRNKLHTALLTGNFQQAQEYIMLGADLNIKDGKHERSCVAWAAKGANIECMKLLKEHMTPDKWNASLNETDKYHNLPLHLVVFNSDNVELFEFIHKEANHTLTEIAQRKAGLYHFVFSNHNNQDIFKYINANITSDEKKYLLNLRSEEGENALAWHVLKNHTDAVKALLGLPELEINQPSFCYYSTPLIIAAQNGNLEIINLLLDKGADIEFVDFRNINPLLSAIKHKRYEAAELLLEKGADVNKTLSKDSTPLHLQIRYKHKNTQSIVFILTHGGIDSIWKEDIYGFRPFEWLEDDLDIYLNTLTDLSIDIKQQIKNSFRKKAKIVDGSVVQKILINKFPETKIHVDGGICNAYGFLAAFSYFNNNLSLDKFYEEQLNFISEAEKSSPESNAYLERWANDILWLQSSEKMKQQIFAKPKNKEYAMRCYNFFSQRDRKKTFPFITDKPIYGPTKQISLFFQACYDGRIWKSNVLESALIKRLSEMEFIEVISEKHESVLIKKDNYFIFIDPGNSNKIIKKLNIKQTVDQLIKSHYLPDKFSKYYYTGIFPFHIRSWSFVTPIFNHGDYEAELYNELQSYLNDELFNHFTPRNTHLFHFCAAMDDSLTLKLLIKMNKDTIINIAHPAVATPLHYAVCNSSFNCVKLLLQYPDIDIYCKNSDGVFMLVDAYRNAKMTKLVLKCLSERGININEISKGDFNFKFFILAGGDMDLINEIFSEKEYELFSPYLRLA